MRLALIGYAPVRGGSTDLLVQARDWFEKRGHTVGVFFGDVTDAVDPRVKDAPVFKAVRDGWREYLRDYRAVVESFRPDVVYAISGRHEMDLFRFLRYPRARHVSSLEQHPNFDVPYTLSNNSSFMEACTANTPDAMEQVHKLTGRPTFLLPYLFPEPPNTKAVISFYRILDAKEPIEIAFVSRLEKLQKRVHWLPDIIRQVRDAGGNATWLFYGDGPEEAELKKRMKEFSNVTFHGWVDRSALYQKLPTHDLFFLCSLWEGLPIAMVEAMRCGLACVAPNIPAGIRWTLEQGGGWLYEADSPRACSAALLRVLADRKLIVKKRHEAQTVAAKLFKSELAEAGYLELEAQLQKLKFNGNALDLDKAPRLRSIPLKTFLKRTIAKKLKQLGS